MHYILLEGNTQRDCARNGWFLGHFMPDRDLRHTTQLEARHAHFKQDEAENEFTNPILATTFWLVTRGILRNEYVFSDGKEATVVCHAYEYAIIAPGARSKWYAAEDCEVIMMRWPSNPLSCSLPLRSYEPSHTKYNFCNQQTPFMVSAYFLHPYGDLRAAGEIQIRLDRFALRNKKGIFMEDKTSSCSILLKGRALVNFPRVQRKIALVHNGDYFLNNVVQTHYIEAEQGSEILTVSWPQE